MKEVPIFFFKTYLFIVPVSLLAIAGIWALIWCAYYNFKSVIQIIFNVIIPKIIRKLNKSLPEKYGKWAGK